MKQIRCTQCNKLLAVADYRKLEIKCPRCKFFNKLERPERLDNKRGHHGKKQKTAT